MAKQIKTLKCPQCGSTSVTALGNEMFRCNSCESEFFLDDDDININHFHYNEPFSNQPKNNPKAGIIILCVLGFFFLFFILMSVLTKKASNPDAFAKEDWSQREVFFGMTAANKPVYVVVGFRDNSREDKEHTLYIGFYDAITKQKIKINPLPFKAADDKIEFKEFLNKNLYFIVNEKNIFQVNLSDLSAQEISAASLSHLKGLESGVVKVQFGYDFYDYFFRITNTAGQVAYYYPLVNKSYVGEFTMDTPKQLIPATRFLFACNRDLEFEKCYLGKYEQQYNTGDVIVNPRISLALPEDENNTDPKAVHFKLDSSLLPYSKVSDLINFTPDRVYYENAHLIAQNDTSLLIGFKAMPEDNAHWFVQVMDVATAKIKWTYEITNDDFMYYPSDGKITKDGCFVYFAREAAFFDNTGKLVSEMHVNF